MSQQHGDGIVSMVKSAGKVIGKAIRFTASGIRKISNQLTANGIPLSKQASYLAKLAKTAKYAKSAAVLMAASKALKQSGRGDVQIGKPVQEKETPQDGVLVEADLSARPRPTGRKPTRKVDLSANNVIQLAWPNADQKYDTNKELPQLAKPNASMGSTPLFTGMSAPDASRSMVGGIPRAWGNTTQGNMIAATSDAMPRF